MKNKNLYGVFPMLFGPKGADFFREFFKWMNNSFGTGTMLLNMKEFGIAGDNKHDCQEEYIVDQIVDGYERGTIMIGPTTEIKERWSRSERKYNKKAVIHRYHMMYLSNYRQGGGGSAGFENLDEISDWLFPLCKMFDPRCKNDILVKTSGERCGRMVAMRKTKKELKPWIDKDLTPTEDELSSRVTSGFTVNDTLFIVKSGSYYYLYRLFKHKKMTFKILDSLKIKYDIVRN
jgi:hypothetical protein